MAKIHLNTKKILTDSCNVERLPVAADSYNRKSGARTTVATGVPCRLLPYTGRPKRTDKDVVTGLYIVFLMPITTPSAVTITEHDWLDVGGLKYDVTLVTPPLMDGLPFELVVERVKP